MKGFPYAVRVIAVLFVAFAFIPAQLRAGNFSLNIGVNHSWLVYRDFFLPVNNQFRPGLSIGLNSIQRVFSDVEFTVGLRLFTVGRRDEGTVEWIDQFGSVMRSDYDLRVHHLYVSTPLRIGYQVVEGLYPFVNLEPAVQLRSGLEFRASTGENDKRTFTDEMNTFNTFIGFGLKYIFRVDQHQFGISGQFNLGLLRVSKDARFDVTEDGYRSWVDWRAREVVMHVEYYFDI